MTDLYFSLSQKPGKFGTIIYNELFKEYGLDCHYQALACSEYRFKETIEALKLIGTKGVSVSMPFKKEAYHYCSKHDEYSEKIKNANTIDLVNKVSYNTDYLGLMDLLKEKNCNSALICGTGAISDTFVQVFRDLNYKEIVALPRKLLSLINHISSFDVLVNATPIGMDGVEDNLFKSCGIFGSYKCIVDVVVRKNTNLVDMVRKCSFNGADVITGVDIAIQQLKHQFKIYTGFDVETETIKQIVNESGLL